MGSPNQQQPSARWGRNFYDCMVEITCAPPAGVCHLAPLGRPLSSSSSLRFCGFARSCDLNLMIYDFGMSFETLLATNLQISVQIIHKENLSVQSSDQEQPFRFPDVVGFLKNCGEL